MQILQLEVVRSLDPNFLGILRTNADGAIPSRETGGQHGVRKGARDRRRTNQRAGGLRSDTPNKRVRCMIFSFLQGHNNPFPMRRFAIPGKIRAIQSASGKLQHNRCQNKTSGREFSSASKQSQSLSEATTAFVRSANSDRGFERSWYRSQTLKGTRTNNVNAREGT